MHIAISLALLEALSAFAASNGSAPTTQAQICIPAAEASHSLMVCEDNQVLIQQGEACLDSLERVVAAASESLAKSFAQPGDGSSQSRRFADASLDGTLASKRLAQVIVTADQAKHEVEGYRDALIPPEDEDVAENPGAYDDSVDCFGDSRAALNDILLDFDFERNQLLRSKAVVDATLHKTQDREASLTATPSSRGNTIAHGVDTTKAAPVPSGASEQVQSDITGTKEDELLRNFSGKLGLVVEGKN